MAVPVLAITLSSPCDHWKRASVIFAIGVYIGVDQTAEDDVAAVIDVDVATD